MHEHDNILILTFKPHLSLLAFIQSAGVLVIDFFAFLKVIHLIVKCNLDFKYFDFVELPVPSYTHSIHIWPP